MELTDDKIQQQRREKKRKQHIDFSQPVLVSEQYYEFIRTTIIEETASILLPGDFVDMPLDIAKIKYPMENRPQIIKTSDDTGINFAFSLYNERFLEAQTATGVKTLSSFIKRMQPSARFYTTQIEKNDNITIGWFDLKTPGMDTQLYTIMALASINEMMLHCTFNCDFRLMNDWNPVAIETFLSLVDETKKQE